MVFIKKFSLLIGCLMASSYALSSDVVKSDEYFPIYSRFEKTIKSASDRDEIKFCHYEKVRTFYALLNVQPGFFGNDIWSVQAIDLLKSNEDASKIDFLAFLKKMKEPTAWGELNEEEILQAKFEGIILGNGKLVPAEQIDLPGKPVRRANRSMYFCEDTDGAIKKQNDPYVFGLRLKKDASKHSFVD